MKILKKATLAAAASLALLSGQSYASGIPVVDAAQIAANEFQHVEQIAKWAIQLQDMKTQIENMRGVWSTLKDGRGMANLLNDDLIQQFLPQDYWDIAKKVTSGSGDWGGISGSVMNIVRENQFKACSQLNQDPDLRASCEKQWKSMAMTQQIGDMGYKKAAQNISNLQTYIQQINASSDQKVLGEIQARIQVEQVRMQNEKMKLDTIQMMEAANQRMQTQKVSDGFTAALNTFNRPSF